MGFQRCETMSVTVLLPRGLAKYCDGNSEQLCQPGSLDEIVDELVSRFPSLASRVRDKGQLRSHLLLFHDGEPVSREAFGRLTLVDGQELRVVFLAGGG